MSLPQPTRQAVIDFVFRDLVPDTGWTAAPSAWFLREFSFIPDPTLRKHLAEAFYQARMAEKLRAALGLKGGFNNTFIKTQVLLYASIYEAVVDWLLESHISAPEVQAILHQEIFQVAGEAFGKATKLRLTLSDGTEEDLVPCRKKQRKQKFKEIQFKERLATAVRLKLVPADLQGTVEKLYTARNRIHLMQAAAEDFKPDPQQSSEAFKNLSRFLKHASQVKPHAPADA
jgi:hypothetical protein